MTPEELDLRDALLDYTRPPLGLPARVFETFQERTHGHRTAPHWLIGAAAVALAVVVVGTFMVVARGLHAGGESKPAASGSRLLPSVAPTSSPSVTGACEAAYLDIRLLGVTQAMNQPRAEFELISNAAAPCHMYGWPDVQMLDAGGRSLPTKLIQATSFYVPGAEERPVQVVLQPGGHAFFGVGWANSVAPGPCEHPATFRVTPPGANGSADVGVLLGDGTPPEVCAGRTLNVLPVQPAAPAGISFNVSTSPRVSPPERVTGDQAGSFCLVNGGASLRIDFSGGSPPLMHVVARALPANSDFQLFWANQPAGGATYGGHFVTDANGNADVHPSAAPLPPPAARWSVYVSYYPPGTNSSNDKPTPYGQAGSC